MSCEMCRASRSTESIEVTLKRSFCFTGSAPWESDGIPIRDLSGRSRRRSYDGRLRGPRYWGGLLGGGLMRDIVLRPTGRPRLTYPS